MKNMRHRLPIIIIAIILAIVGCWALYSYVEYAPDYSYVEEVSEPPVNVTPFNTPIDESAIERLVNDERSNLGLQPLIHSEQLRNSACLKARDMIAKDYWSHNTPSGERPWIFFSEAGYVFDKAGENLSFSFMSSEGIVNAWMNSESHRANIAGDYTEFGVCTIKAEKFQGKYGVYVGVSHFGTPK